MLEFKSKYFTFKLNLFSKFNIILNFYCINIKTLWKSSLKISANSHNNFKFFFRLSNSQENPIKPDRQNASISPTLILNSVEIQNLNSVNSRWMDRRKEPHTKLVFPNDRVLSNGFWFSVSIRSMFLWNYFEMLSINQSDFAQNNRLIDWIF